MGEINQSLLSQVYNLFNNPISHHHRHAKTHTGCIALTLQFKTSPVVLKQHAAKSVKFAGND